MVHEMTVVEEAIVDSSKKMAGLQDSIKNLKKQYKELFGQYQEGKSSSLAIHIADILVEIEDKKDDIKSLKRDIAVNIEELSKPKQNG